MNPITHLGIPLFVGVFSSMGGYAIGETVHAAQLALIGGTGLSFGLACIIHSIWPGDDDA